MTELSDMETSYLLEAVRLAVGDENVVVNAMLIDEQVGVHNPVNIWSRLEFEGYLDSRGTLARGVSATGFRLTDEGIEYGRQRGATKGESSF